jgi:putative membrane protein
MDSPHCSTQEIAYFVPLRAADWRDSHSKFLEAEMRRRNDASAWKGLAAGLAGGLAGAWAMEQFQTIWSNAEQKRQQRENPQKAQQQGNGQQSADATMKTAEAISESFIGRPLSYQEQKRLGPIVHYGFGTLMGGLYGAATEKLPALSKGLGLTYATALFVGADEVAVPALGLGPHPVDTPLSKHAYALMSHWVYGFTADLVRRGVRFAL